MALVAKSFAPGEIFCDDVHPGGRSGGESESKDSMNGNDVPCESAPCDTRTSNNNLEKI
jgi:hypothetical protein